MKASFLGAAALAVAVASPTLAQEARSGMFIGLNAGMAMLSDPALKLTDPSSTPNNTLESHLRTSSAFAFGGEIGHRFGNFALSSELQYQSNKVKGMTFDRLNGAAVPAAAVSEISSELFGSGVSVSGTTVTANNGELAKFKQLAAMPTITYEYPLGSLSPFIGAGAGLVVTWLDATNVDAVSTRFAWQVKAGVSYAMSESLSLVIDYTYRQTSKGRLNSSDGLLYDLGSTKTSRISGGVRYQF